ncbi:TadE/TadG family type IV pilus assembly protein [Methylobacterium durans]|uniref:TadE/TadG family type IV pilus assembly protein n=1 Tax=Methylobacterium durans TaxID=2202825 RepID=UPI002AFEE98A|nr:TadE/TadG family type IV pilus assembly protein [Methylobacterium durans]MEA1830460.1 TadE/TadG family type IV pilus assembly protein [Methylobacterium durans]
MTLPAASPYPRRPPVRLPSLLARRLASFGSAQGGTSAVEFALIGIPFLGLLFAIFEVGLTFLVSQNLNTQLANASRLIYTGEFQNTAGNKTGDAATILKNLRTALCQNGGKTASTFFDCTAVKVNVLSVSSFASAAAIPTTIDPGSKKLVWNPTFGKQYSCGRGNEIMVVQAAVEYPVFLSQLYAPATLLANGRRVIQAATAFRIEPLNNDPC